MRALLAALPLVAVLVLMLWRRWSTAKAGLAGVFIALAVAALGFGLTWRVVWVSQARGVMLAFYVLYIIWPGLLLYQLVRQAGGIARLNESIAGQAPNAAAAALLLAWPLSSLLEGIAGFGVPLAVVSPMVVALGFDPITAVVATAVGHAWSVTFGDMGVVFEALVAVVHWEASALVPAAALLLGVSAIASGIAVALILRLRGRWGAVLLVGAVMGVVQGGLALVGLRPLAALGAGAAGLLTGLRLLGGRAAGAQPVGLRGTALRLLPYILTTALLAPLAFIPALATGLSQPRTAFPLPEVRTATGFITAAGSTKAIPWLVHPGTAMLVSLVACSLLYARLGLTTKPALRSALVAAAKTGLPVSLGVMAMMSLAMVLDHAGMTQALARWLSDGAGLSFPLLSPSVGLLGAFTTGSNTNSNVLFGPLQVEMARLLNLSPVWLLSGQTAGGALGSMVAPTKLVIGCAAVGALGQDGRVLARTAPYAVALMAGLGALCLLLA